MFPSSPGTTSTPLHQKEARSGHSSEKLGPPCQLKHMRDQGPGRSCSGSCAVGQVGSLRQLPKIRKSRLLVSSTTLTVQTLFKIVKIKDYRMQ